MKTTRRQFLQGLIATAATAAIAPQALVETVHGASDLTPRERDAVADAMGLGQKQWRGASPMLDGHINCRGWTYSDKDDALHYGMYGLRSPDEVISPSAGIEQPSELFGIPIERGVFRENHGVMSCGYLIPDEYRRRILDALNQEWDRQFLEGTGSGVPVGILSLDDNEYDNEPKVLHYGVSPLKSAFRDWRNAQAIEQWVEDHS